MREKVTLPEVAMLIRKSSSVLLVFCSGLVLLCVIGVAAQSGRRVRKPEPVPIATPKATPSAEKPAEKPKPAITFIVGLDRSDFSRIPLSVSSAVRTTCANRLDESDSVAVVLAPGDMTRGDAVRRAKSEKEGFVVSLRLRQNNLTGSSNDPYNVEIEYSVLAPITAKQETSGRVFPAMYNNRGVIVKPNPSVLRGDYYLNEAAKEVARRILDHFHIRTSRLNSQDVEGFVSFLEDVIGPRSFSIWE